MRAAQLDLLIRRIGGLRGLAWGVADFGEDDLFPEEAAVMTRACPARRAEFAAGRQAARRAMARLGLDPTPIPMGPDRAPVWPDGIVGSISHAQGLCLAVVARARDVLSLGVDVEGDAPLTAELIPEICLPEELALLPDAARPALATRLFSAKEAAYKAHYPLASHVFGFHGLAVDLTEGRARFTDHPEVAAIPPESRMDLPLRQATGGGLILSLCATPARAPSH
ncbi:4'-phosphopantetheinyl transferase EntD (siderophore biosynthesis) [Antarctobacter heliothermus]|uniref:Enterobactin synthase component D n=2 Tax=Antarctobacter heliothermus TaxID=74033 RepID=A0A239E219_9RHOB|nr:4'-phosphopantetheinyl transferase EntD (siderophore biosynthesis) [Antarctobacter heliothermus]